MKYIWTEEDIIPGRIVCKPRIGNDGAESSWRAKWTSKIGWEADRYRLICMADGLITGPYTKEKIVKHLNDNDLIPMPHKWLLELIEYIRDMYETE